MQAHTHKHTLGYPHTTAREALMELCASGSDLVYPLFFSFPFLKKQARLLVGGLTTFSAPHKAPHPHPSRVVNS